MKLPTENYLTQSARWPQQGQHILAQHDDASVMVYQAYRPSTGAFAIAHGRLGGPDFSFNRMSWIKPNFLWMMYRSGWGTKPGQEVTLGLRIRRPFFEALLAQAVPSSFDPARYANEQAWKDAVAGSEVRQQWDPDHAPDGSKLERRAIQLGLRGDALRALAETELLEVIDMSAFVDAQRGAALGDVANLQTPVEHVFKSGSC
jgi:Domain of unknown function (DUF4291)